MSPAEIGAMVAAAAVAVVTATVTVLKAFAPPAAAPRETALPPVPQPAPVPYPSLPNADVDALRARVHGLEERERAQTASSAEWRGEVREKLGRIAEQIKAFAGRKRGDDGNRPSSD